MAFDFEDYHKKVNAVPSLPRISIISSSVLTKVNVDENKVTHIIQDDQFIKISKPEEAIRLGKFLIETFSDLSCGCSNCDCTDSKN